MAAARRRQRKEEAPAGRRADILRRATELFHARGFASTSLDDVARAVGIRREGIYYYFPSRVQLLLAIVMPIAENLRDRLAEIVASDAAPADKLRLAVTNHFARLGHRPAETQVALRDDYVEAHEEAAATMGPVREAYEALWVRLIREGQQAGAFDPAIDARLACQAVIGMCNRAACRYVPKQPPALSILIDQHVALIGNGLVGRR